MRQAADDGLAGRIERIGVERFIDEWLANPMTSTDAVDAATRAADRNIRLENSAAGLAAALRGIGQGSVADISERLASLPMPTVFMAGEDDDSYSTLAAAMAARRRERPLLVPNTGHNVVLEDPEAVTVAIRELLSLQNP